jgi:uncharacterized membrane protein
LHAGGQRFESAHLQYEKPMNPILKIIIFSLLPISELRGSIPIGLSSGLPLYVVFPVAVLSNVLVFPIFYFFLTFIHELLMNLKLYRRTFDYFLERTRRRVGPKVEKYGYLGLTLFVAIPLPVTGAYTGTLGAWVFKLKKRKSFLAVILGVIIAGVIVSVVSVFGIHIFDIFIKKNL